MAALPRPGSGAELTTPGRVKGKVLVDLSEAAVATTSLCAPSTARRRPRTIDRQWCDIAPLANTEGGGLMDPCSHDEAAEQIAASALTLALVDVAPDQCAELLVGAGSLEGLCSHERAIVSAHWRTLVWADNQGYAGVAEAQMEGIASALGLEHDVCDWEQLFSVFPKPWFVESPVAAAPKLIALRGASNRHAS